MTRRIPIEKATAANVAIVGAAEISRKTPITFVTRSGKKPTLYAEIAQTIPELNLGVSKRESMPLGAAQPAMQNQAIPRIDRIMCAATFMLVVACTRSANARGALEDAPMRASGAQGDHARTPARAGDAPGAVATVGADTSDAQSAVATAPASKQSASDERRLLRIPGSTESIAFVPIPAGEIEIAAPTSTADSSQPESPRKIAIAAFEISACEITWDAYDSFVFMRDRAGF